MLLVYQIVLHGIFPLQFENIDNIFQVEAVWKVVVWLWDNFDVVVVVIVSPKEEIFANIFPRCLIWLLIMIIFAIHISMMVGALIQSI